MAKDTVEGNLFIDVRYLNREGKLEPGLHFLSWTRGGEPAGSITLRTEQDTITLIYSHSRYGRGPGTGKPDRFLDLDPGALWRAAALVCLRELRGACGYPLRGGQILCLPKVL